MSSALVVVIILVVVVAAVAGATLRDGPQPATRRAPQDDAPPEADDLAFPTAFPTAVLPAPLPYRQPDAEPGPVLPVRPAPLPHALELDDLEDGYEPDDGVPEIRGARERVAALGRLAVAVVVLGGAAAALLGASALAGFQLLDRALG